MIGLGTAINVGLINDHGKDCPCFEEINKTADIVRLPVDDEA